jgi:hypothetical protein
MPALVYAGVLHLVAIAAVATLLGTGHLDATVGASFLGGLFGTGVGSGLTLLPGSSTSPFASTTPAPSLATAEPPATPAATGPAGIGSAGSTTPAGSTG